MVFHTSEGKFCLPDNRFVRNADQIFFFLCSSEWVVLSFVLLVRVSKLHILMYP